MNNQGAIPQLLKGKKIWVGKDPTKSRLQVYVMINGQPKSALIGTEGSVPSSVSRCVPEQQAAHITLEISQEGAISVTNLKPQNVSYVNGIEILTKRVSGNDTLELGKDRFPVQVSMIFSITEKIILASEGAKEKQTFNIAPLEKVWNVYHDKGISLQRQAKQQAVQARIPMFFTMGGGAISSIAFVCGWGNEVKGICVTLTLIGLFIMWYTFMKTKNDTSIEERERITEEFQDQYVCPNPQCRKFLGNYSYRLMKRQYSMTCPFCKCKFIEE